MVAIRNKKAVRKKTNKQKNPETIQIIEPGLEELQF